MKIACVLLPDFEVAVELRRRPELAGRPVVVGGLPHERKTVLGRSPEAAAYGVAEGMPLRRAHGLCPEATFLPADEKLYQETFARVLRVLDSFSPRVEVSYQLSAVSTQHAALAYLDASGLELLFGPDEELGARMAAAIEGETGLHPRVGLAGGKFTAWLAALVAPPGPVLVVKAGDERSFLAPLPVKLLPCSQEMQRRLRLLGLGTLGQLAELPAGALAEQFGPEGAEAYRLARGIDERPVVAREAPAVLEEEMELDPPAGESGVILLAASVLIDRLVAGLRSGYLTCREVALLLGFSDGSAAHTATTLHEPTDRADDLRRAVERLLGRAACSISRKPVVRATSGTLSCSSCTSLFDSSSSPPSLLRLSLSGFGGRQGEQLGLFRGRARDLEKARRAVGRAGAQLGEGIIRPLAEPEGKRPAARPFGVAVDAQGLPMVLFLEGKREMVLEVCNRWRVEEDWWRRAVSREYYRVITESGRLCLMYRDLTPRPGANLTPRPPSPWGKGGRSSTPWFLERIYA